MGYLHCTEFTWIVQKDSNRADDGIGMRYRFASSRYFNDELFPEVMDALDGPCSVLEMMIALAVRCEEDTMDNAEFGDRTGQWFWGMINSLGLHGEYDAVYDKSAVELSIERFLNRTYCSDGRGGLFTIRNCRHDMRKAEIWHQLCWYLGSIT